MKKITLYGFFALLILGFAIVPSSTKADFFDDFVDFLDPTQHIGNILEGRPRDNFPFLPGLPIDLDLSTTVVNNYYTPSHNPPHRPSPAPRPVCQDINAINYYGTLPCRYPPPITIYQTAYYQPYSPPHNYQPPIENVSVSLRADDSNIDFEDNTVLRWSSSNADTCRTSGGANGWSGSINTSGSFNTRSLTDTTTYRITCYNNSDSASDSVTVYVDDEEDESNEPDVTTRSATNVGTGSATLNGRVDGNGSSARAWFEYGANTNFGYLTSRNSYGSRSINYDKNISGLMPNTTYYFRAVAENSRDTVYGNILSFNTGGGPVNIVNIQPTVAISADSTNIAYNSATNIRWFTTNASSCFASGGSAGWAGVKNIGPGSFYTGLLTSSKTYTITCSNNAGSSTDSVTVIVRGQITATPAKESKPVSTSLVLINSSIDRSQPIISTLDNIKPRPGDEINYTVSYQNIGNASITGIILRIDLPYQVDYIFSNPNNPIKSGNTLVFSLGTSKANSQNTVTVRLRVQNNVPAGINLNFPATLNYIDPFNFPKSVNTNVSAQVWSEPASAPSSIDKNENAPLGANAFGAGFLPTNLLGWSLLLVLILLLMLIAKYLFGSSQPFAFHKQTIPVSSHPLDLDKETATTIKTQGREK